MLNIISPTLLLDEKKCRANLQFMTAKAQINNLIFRPHFKTHQSAEIGNWFREYGVDKITVSSVKMAEYFANNGWKDITIAFPTNILEIDSINELAKKINLNLLVESVEVAEFLSVNINNDAGVFIEIDTGSHRSGVDYNNTKLIAKIIDNIAGSPNLQFRGFLTHSGSTYVSVSREHVNSIHNQAVARLNELKEFFSDKADNVIVSIGDTPSATLAEDFNGVDEIRAGNFIFYDVMQHELNVCKADKIAVCLACPVVSVHAERQELIVYGGGVHLSKDGLTSKNGNRFYGLVTEITGSGWGEPLTDCYVKSISQEHGIIKVGENEIKKFKPGDLIGVLPVHSCLTADLMKEYLTLDNKKISMMR